jgi:hypothetical protein
LSQQSNSEEASGAKRSSRQALTPLFAIALALTAVGFYLAYDDEADVDLGREAPDAFGQVEPIELPDGAVDTSVEAVELVHAEAKPHAIELMLRQKSRTEDASGGAHTLDTAFELGLEQDVTVADATRFEKERVLAITRHYQRARASVSTGDGELLGPGITSQVEELLRGSITRLYVAPSGEPLDFEWREVPNPQARRMLFLVRDAHTFLTPRFFNAAVNPGDTWSYQRPLMVEEPDLGVNANGQVDIDNRFVGVLTHEDRRLGVVRQTLKASVEGTLAADETSATFTLDGSGEGLVLVDLGAGRVHTADVEFERTLTIDSGGEPTVQVSEIFLGLRPKGGVTLPDFEEKAGEDDQLEASNEE